MMHKIKKENKVTIDSVSGLFNQHQLKYEETITNTYKKLEEFAKANGVCLTIAADTNALDFLDENQFPIIINIEDSQTDIKIMYSIDASSGQSLDNGVHELCRMVYTQIVKINPEALPVLNDVVIAPQ
jgi:effector-binding domain-containing protein